MSEFYSRTATVADMLFIMGEFEDGAHKGHFYDGILTSEVSKTFEQQLRLAIKTNEQGQYSGHFIYILLRRSDDKKVGLVWFCAALDPTGVPRFELRAVSIVKELRGKGYGSMFVSEMLESNPSQPMMAKCYVKSSQMADMLKRRGFYLFDTSPKGMQMLFRDPKKKASHTRMHLKN
ncbi:TPA: N-acetyltransferase [Escherichia coli]|uniref:GNAT family acetyltransferase n=1 Tax=Escherichia coli TaxID=562 RepID=UPI000B428D9E|nr:GNAT family acetyltransferase [Escherichia coli]EKM0513162.1 N-acetyltransferase [Salmonella enterica]ELZ5569660.1 N-acetyltransferase [Escherichia coli]OWE05132.1 GNAT family acetyltransferase [Escherichia coli]RCP00246.1 N-acetyltransferase [Escherichia coli]HAH2668801.1 N-acetyltransferase [Escherichia coli]